MGVFAPGLRMLNIMNDRRGPGSGGGHLEVLAQLELGSGHVEAVAQLELGHGHVEVGVEVVAQMKLGRPHTGAGG